MDDDKPLTQNERLALADRDEKGRFLPGHKKSSAGRPVGVVNKISRSLRDQVLEGLGDVPEFIRDLKREVPGAAAALLSKLIPPPTDDADLVAGATVNFVIGPVTSGTFLPPLEIEPPSIRTPELHVIGGRDVDEAPTIEHKSSDDEMS
jgi:hypothetical protein